MNPNCLIPDRRLVRALLLFGVAGCQVPGGDGEAEELARLVATEELRIGSVEDPDVGFSQLGRVAVGEDGTMYVHEILDNQIRVYDESGRRVGTIGGPGQGPGEFGSLRAFGVVGDTVWTIDRSLRRLTLFDRVGRVRSTGTYENLLIPLQRPGTSGMVAPRAMRVDGLFTADMTGFMMQRNAAPSSVGENDTVPVPMVLFDPSGQVTDTIGWEPYPPPDQSASSNVDVGGVSYYVPRPPSNEPLVVRTADGRFVVDRARAATPERATFTVHRLTEGGDTIYRSEIPYTPSAYPDVFLDSLARSSARIPGGATRLDGTPFLPAPEGISIGEIQRRIRAAMDFPELQVAIQSGVAGDDGTLWLERPPDGSSTRRWLILDESGAPRGDIELPTSYQVRWVSRDRFIAVEMDELDIPWLMRFRIGA